MRRLILSIFFVFACLSVAAQQADVVVFWEAGFPSADSSAPTREQLSAAVPHATFVASDGLPAVLLQARVLVLPYGSAFPESAWSAIHDFLRRGGNLVAVGGRPFTHPAYRDRAGAWKLREENYAFARALNLIDYQATGSSAETKFVANNEVMSLPPFTWKRAWSLVVRLSEQDTSSREGAAGRMDARLTPLAWGERERRKVATPVAQIDHLRGNFAGGRWVLATAELTPDFSAVVSRLVTRASEGAEDFRVQAASPLLLPGEPIRLQVKWTRSGAPPPAAQLRITVRPERGKESEETVPLPASDWPVSQWVELPASAGAGFHTVTAALVVDGKTRANYHTGFWMRDLEYLRSGAKLTVDHDFFQLDGHPLPVVGTTYMASDAQRLFFAEPNPYVWDQDMAQIAGNGLNMLRTGWWSGWSDLVDNDVATEHTLRTMEAFLMTARRHNLPVQWTLFAFMPEVFGGGNPYLSLEALRRQKEFVSSVVARFKEVPFVAWDLINEPSFDNPERFWSTRPNGDAAERAAWNEWLKKRYPGAGERESAWRSLPSDGAAVPENRDFAERAAYNAGHPVAAYDFHLFAQEKFAEWAATMREAIRAAGGTQLVTVGQDEGGGTDRPSPAFYAPAVDFTTTHTWWLNDALLWDSLVARVPGKPMLTQETGFQREWGLDGRPRRDPESEAKVLERKIAAALGTGAGAIQWLWNVNPWMTSEQEVTIGAVRPDGTEKPEVEVMRQFAKFASQTRDYFKVPELPEVAIVTSQALQYSVFGSAAIEAQQRAVRVLHYDLHVPAYVVTENNLASLGKPKLVILPSPQALSDAAWQRLMEYVKNGGQLLVSGSPERDDHWRGTTRLRDLGIDASAEPLTFRAGEMRIGEQRVTVQFSGPRQLALESLRMGNGWSEKQVGKGILHVAAYPVELADGPEATRSIYSFVLDRAGVRPPFTGYLPTGILARPVMFGDSILYLLVSEVAAESEIDLQDRVTGGRIHVRLPSQRAVLVLLDRKTGAVLTKSD